MHDFTSLNEYVTAYLDSLNHTSRIEIDALRVIILDAAPFEEQLDNNRLFYSIHNKKVIALEMQPDQSVQVIFHMDENKYEHVQRPLINTPLWIHWTGNNQATASFSTIEEIIEKAKDLVLSIQAWVIAAQYQEEK